MELTSKEARELLQRPQKPGEKCTVVGMITKEAEVTAFLRWLTDLKRKEKKG